MTQTISAVIQHQFESKSTWEVNNPVLLAGQIGIEKITNRIKIGDGTKTWQQLAYFSRFENVTHTEKNDDYFYFGISADPWLIIRRQRQTGVEAVIDTSASSLSFDEAWADHENVVYVDKGGA